VFVNSFTMELNKKSTDDSQKIIDKTVEVIHRQYIDNLNYLYPNGHRITHQMRWFKGSRDRGLVDDNAA